MTWTASLPSRGGSRRSRRCGGKRQREAFLGSGVPARAFCVRGSLKGGIGVVGDPSGAAAEEGGGMGESHQPPPVLLPEEPHVFLEILRQSDNQQPLRLAPCVPAATTRGRSPPGPAGSSRFLSPASQSPAHLGPGPPGACAVPVPHRLLPLLRWGWVRFQNGPHFPLDRAGRAGFQAQELNRWEGTPRPLCPGTEDSRGLPVSRPACVCSPRTLQ